MNLSKEELRLIWQGLMLKLGIDVNTGFKNTVRIKQLIEKIECEQRVMDILREEELTEQKGERE